MRNYETNPIKRFDRHAEMSGDTRGEVLSIIGEMDSIEDESFNGHIVENYLFALFDGYFYDQELTNVVEVIKEYSRFHLAHRIENLIAVIRTYNLRQDS